jgi:amino acid transporter
MHRMSTHDASTDLPSSESAPSIGNPHFTRSLGFWSAVAVNMTQMCGIGPFVTIPLVVAKMGGPQALVGWIVGAMVVMADGLVWAELGAAMPGAGGTYLYLREAFQYRTGRLMPFLFIWTVILAIPLIMSTGVIGLVKYLGYYVQQLHQSGHNFPDLIRSDSGSGILRFVAVTGLGAAVSLSLVAIVIFALYRNITAIKRLTVALWIVMFLTVATVIAASFSHFDYRLAFDFPAGAFHLDRKFFAGLGAALVLAVYDYLGYNTTAYMGAELRDPGRVMPGSIIYSILGMMAIYLTMNIGILGVMPWNEVTQHQDFIGSEVLERTWGSTAAMFFTALVVITAFASIFTGLLGGSRVPFNAARDRLFFSVFGRLHPRLNFPYVALLFMGVVTAIGSLFDLTTVINMLFSVTFLVQAVAQIVALTVLRARQPTLRRPYRMLWYPLPSIVALIGWLYVFIASGWPMLLDSPDAQSADGANLWSSVALAPGTLSLGWLALGVIAFLIWARFEQTWPFGPKEIREEFLQSQSTATGGVLSQSAEKLQ